MDNTSKNEEQKNQKKPAWYHWRRWKKAALYSFFLIATLSIYLYGIYIAGRIWGDELPVMLAGLKPWLYVWRFSMYAIVGYFWFGTWRKQILNKLLAKTRNNYQKTELLKSFRKLEWASLGIIVAIEAINLKNLISVWELL